MSEQIKPKETKGKLKKSIFEEVSFFSYFTNKKA